MIPDLVLLMIILKIMDVFVNLDIPVGIPQWLLQCFFLFFMNFSLRIKILKIKFWL